MLRTILLSVAALLVTANAYAQSGGEQPAVPHAYYGRDGFWHCDPGYAAGQSGGCEPVVDPQLFSATGRLREFETSERVNATTPAMAH